MQNFQDKRTHRKLLYSHATIAFLVLVVIVLANAVWGIYQKRSLAQESRMSADEELAMAQQRKQLLEADIARLTSAQGKEAEMRAKFQVAKPGEDVIIIIDEGLSAATTSSALQESKGFWDVLQEFFKKL